MLLSSFKIEYQRHLHDQLSRGYNPVGERFDLHFGDPQKLAVNWTE